MPQDPEWLDDKHLWTTGVPVHYLAIFTGYLVALWVWRRARTTEDDRADPGGSKATSDAGSPAALALSSLVAAILILVISGIITHAVLMGSFPGMTYFIQHLLIGFVFLYLWSAYVGMGGPGWPVGALMLSLIWTSYGIYLGPTGLPGKVHYLGFDELWFRAFPGDFLSALIGLFVTIRLLPRLSRRTATSAVAPFAAMLMLIPQEAEAKPKGFEASASASGNAHRVIGLDPVNMRSVGPAKGWIQIKVVEAGNRWSHVQSQDAVQLVADFTAGDGRYQVIVDKAMPRHPLGKYTTWNGVALLHDMHGETGIGTPKLPLMKPDISLYGWGKVYRDGQLLAAMAPVHAMVTSKGAMTGVMLEVDTEEKSLLDVPDGFLTVNWPNIGALAMPHAQMRRRELLGWAGLLGLALLFGVLAHRSGPRRA